MVCLTLKLTQRFFVYRTQSKENFFTEKELVNEKEKWRIEQKHKEGFLTNRVTEIKRNSPTSIKKHANELKVHKKTVGTAIKQDFNQDLNPLNYAIWGVLENKTNATSHPNFVSLKTAIEEEWNKMSEEFILKAC